MAMSTNEWLLAGGAVAAVIGVGVGWFLLSSSTAESDSDAATSGEDPTSGGGGAIEDIAEALGGAFEDVVDTVAPETSGGGAGAIIGGVFGSSFGPVGAALGAAAGGFIGDAFSKDKDTGIPNDIPLGDVVDTTAAAEVLQAAGASTEEVSLYLSHFVFHYPQHMQPIEWLDSYRATGDPLTYPN